MAFPNQIENAINKYSALYGVDAALIRAIIQVESGGNPDAKGDYDSAGVPHSFGLMQLNDKGAGAGYRPEYLLDTDNNVRLGTNYLKACIDAFPGDLKSAVSAYNQGITGVRIRGWTFNRAYVERVLSYYIQPAGKEITVPPEGEIPEKGQVVPTEKQTVQHWKDTFDEIAAGCSTYIILAIIIIIIIIIFVRY